MPGTVANCILSALRAFWRGVAILFAAVWPTRVALLLILGGALLLLVHEQGQDLAVRLVERDGKFGDWALFFFATFWWSIQSWLWSRIALDQRFGPLPAPASAAIYTLPVQLSGDERFDSTWLPWLVRAVPRLYAGAVFGLAAGAILAAGHWHECRGWAFLGAGLLVAWFLWKRRSLIDPRKAEQHFMTAGQGKRIGLYTLAAGAARLMEPRQRAWLENSFGATDISRAFTIGSLVLGVVVAVTVWWWPGAQRVGTWFGAASGAFVAFASILAALGLASIFSYRWRVPVVASLLILAPLVSGLMATVKLPLWRDHHAIPVVSASLDGRRTQEEAWTAWRSANPAGTTRTPIVFVATAGGGVRAALWTAVVLDRARQADPTFDRRLFAISGVSGGALGATAYLAALSSGAAGVPGPCTQTPKSYGLCDFGKLARTMFSDDLLGPTLAGAFYGDLLFTFLPVPAPVNSADALSESWRVAWAGAAKNHKAAFSQPFLSHWRVAGWTPVVMLNGTHVETGKRLITTDLKIEKTSIRDAWDLHAIVGGDIDTAMAALNSARFPGVVAGGTVTTADGKRWGHVIDGGYFENSGALGLVELAAGISSSALDTKSLYPIFIEIVSDPDLKVRDYTRNKSLGACRGVGAAGSECERGELIDFLIGLSGPANGIINVRSGHGIWTPRHMADEAARLFSGVEGRSFTFRLCKPDDKARVPLGWQLSGASADEIVQSLPAAPTDIRGPSERQECQKENADALTRLTRALTGPPK